MREDCAKCQQPLQGRVVRALGKSYHADQCFTCGVCSRPIDGAFVTHEGQPIHQHCVRHESVAKGQCSGCNEKIFAGEPAVRLGGSLMHTKCFVCGQCQATFGQGEKYILVEGQPCHAQCSPLAVPCVVCGEKIVEDHVKLGSDHFHHACCVCHTCKAPATDAMVVLGGHAYHVGQCSAGVAGD